MTESSVSKIAYEALNLAKQNERDIAKHEGDCAERYGEIRTSLGKIEAQNTKQNDEIKGILKWAGGTLVSIIIALLGSLVAQQLNSNDQARKSAEAKIELLQRQVYQQQAQGPRAAPSVSPPTP